MDAFKVNNCFFCIDLKIGCLIIAYMSLIPHLILTIVAIVIVALGKVFLKAFDHNVRDNDGTIIMVIGGVFLLIEAFHLTFNIVLLVGLHQDKPGHVKAYVVYACILQVLFIVGFIGIVSTGAMPGTAIAIYILFIILSIYLIVVIQSQYYAMTKRVRGLEINV